ncbi:MAG: tetratricopeptide repeat protein [Alphaproteobacteria bacterium]|nr:tetratricopeptide repeat protein [Alphaproteobacteria bacterium]
MGAATAELMKRALRRHRAGKVAEAAEIYGEILSIEPHNAEALHLLGMTRLQDGDAEGAVELASKALELLPTSADFHNTLGEAHRAMLNIDSAKAHFRASAEAPKPSGEGACNLAALLSDEGEKEEAALWFKRAVDLDPFKAGYQLQLGKALLALGNEAGAEGRFRKTLALDPINAEAHARLGFFHLKRGEAGKAIAEFDQAVAADPKPGEYHRGLGLSWLSFGDPEEAAAHLEKAIEIDPLDLIAIDELTRLRSDED